jgi:SAM-dependent methyltransferase
MPFFGYMRDYNNKLNHRFFPRSQKNSNDCFSELAGDLAFNATWLLHLGAGPVDLSSSIGVSHIGLKVLNLDLGFQEIRKNPGRFRICADAQDLPLASGSMDLICAEHLFEHLPHPDRVLKECFRILKGGGHLIVSGPNATSYIAWAARLTPLHFHNAIRRLGGPSNGIVHDGFPTFYQFNRPRTMRRITQKIGFETVQIETFVGAPCYTTFLPVLHLGFMAYHLFLEKLRPLLGCHITSVAVFRKPGSEPIRT